MKMLFSLLIIVIFSFAFIQNVNAQDKNEDTTKVSTSETQAKSQDPSAACPDCEKHQTSIGKDDCSKDERCIKSVPPPVAGKDSGGSENKNTK